MSVLVALTPTPHREPSAAAPAGAAVVERLAQASWKWVFSSDGQQLTTQGEAPPSRWPKADTLVLALPPESLGWAVTDLPRVPTGRLPAALAGALEDALLEEPQDLHFALPPQAKPGRRQAVAIMRRQELTHVLQAVEGSGREVDRVVPCFAPSSAGGPVRAHFLQNPSDGTASCRLVWADAAGVVALPLEGDGARAWVQQALSRPSGPGPSGSAPDGSADAPQAQQGRETPPGSSAEGGVPISAPPSTTTPPAPTIIWSTTPGAASPAEAWAGHALPVVAEALTWLQAAASTWELRQFELAPRHRGLRAGREAWRRFMGPGWRPVRWGLATLVAANVVGLQAWAWSQQQAVAERRMAQARLLTTTHPQVKTVLDAPLQMARETERLREAAGQPGEADLEAALAAVASAWPPDLGPAQALRFEAGTLTVTVVNLAPAQRGALAERLQALGWSVEATGGRLVLSRRGPSASR